MIRVAGILIIAVGVLILRGQFGPDWLVQQSQTWMSTPGVITSLDARCLAPWKTATCSVRIRYRFQVAGEKLESGRITFNDDNLYTIDDVRQYRARYAVGQRVP